MKEILYISKCFLHFSRWCGKGYAVFAALGKEVRISELSIGICTRSLQKSARKGVITTMALCRDESKEARADEKYKKNNYSRHTQGEVYAVVSQCVYTLKGCAAGIPFYF